MKQSALLVAVVLCGLIATPGYAQRNVSGGTEVVSHYVWRGYALVDGPTLQPYLDVDWEETGLTLSLWGSAATLDRDQYRDVDELDVTLNYAVPAGERLDLSVGVILYMFPGQGRFTFAEQTSPEFYVQAAPHLPLSPEVFLAYDVNLGGDLYAAFSIGRDVSVARRAFSLGITAGYNNGQFEADSGISHLDVSLSTEVALGSVQFSPHVVYVESFENTENKGRRLIFGVGLNL